MSQAILTKILPTTATKPTRIKATCAGGSVVMSYHNILRDTHEEKHAYVARELCEKIADECIARAGGNTLAGKTWLRPMVCGQLPNGDWAHVFTS